MGVNLIAIFPYTQLNEKLDELIGKIEKQEYYSIKEYYEATLSEGFPELPDFGSQWYLDDIKIRERPKLPDINAAIELSKGLVMRFGESGFEIWSLIRAFLAIKFYPKIGQKLCEVYKEIGNEFGANECWIMGDDNPIYHSFLKGQDFATIAREVSEKNELNELYREINEGEYAGSYEIKGYYKLKIRE
ncbi:hypothetical protein V6R21_11515 [Limibacter armeniacum]|uniref:hypothetical protein n=1 Tax=Limibacter armeniacum TaxID=466084 RepID=UPI002FE5D2D7